MRKSLKTSRHGVTRLSVSSPQGKTIQRLIELAKTIFSEAEALVNEAALAELSSRAGVLMISEINFYEEVARFEADLIRLALEHSGGNQSRAARLLCLRATTLHWKIKQYGILV